MSWSCHEVSYLYDASTASTASGSVVSDILVRHKFYLQLVTHDREQRLRAFAVSYLFRKQED